MQLIKNIGGAQSPPTIKTDWFAIAGLFLVSLWVWGPNVHYGHAFMLVLFGFAALFFITGDKTLIVLGGYLACWFAYLYSAAFLGLIPAEVINQATDSLLFIMAGLSIYILVRNGSVEISHYQNGICLLSSIMAGLGLIQFFFGKGEFSVAHATLGNPNFLAAFLAISAPFFFRRKWCVFLPLILGALIATKTATAIAALLIGAGFYLWGWKGSVLAVFPGAAYFALWKNPASLIERLAFWTDALQKISHSWHTLLFGVGPGIYWQAGNMLHSEYAYLVFNLGIVGLILAFIYILQSCSHFTDRRLFASIIVILVDGAGNHLMHTAPTAMLAIIIFALNDRKLAEV
jgi:hypothetical protein